MIRVGWAQERADAGGSYGFGKGGVAQVVRFVTSPVTKLFEFHLGGTMNEPKWTPSNLPKEMFLIFD